MIWGIYNNDPSEHVDVDSLNRMSTYGDGKSGHMNSLSRDHFGVGVSSLPHVRDENATPVENADHSVAVLFQGMIYSVEDKSDTHVAKEKSGACIILKLYESYGVDFVNKLNGKFSFAIIDRKNERVILSRDRFGIEPMFYYVDGNKLLFSSTLASIVNSGLIKKELNFHAIHQYLLFCYNPALYTFYKNVHKLRPGHTLIYEKGNTKIEPYWYLSFKTGNQKTSEPEIEETLLNLLQEAVRIRVDDHLTPGIFLSGGMDSSTMTALSRSYLDGDLHTFSFRCRGESFDESHYAQIVSNHYRTIHHVSEYTANDVPSIQDFVKLIDEPFCDVGINIASYILARNAADVVNCIYTGDGGDELFGGHPVYLADKTAQFFNFLPSFILNPAFSVGRLLPDSEKKKNLIVKIKRFSESYRYPKGLLSHRWRIYYTEKEISNLIVHDLYPNFNSFDPYQVILRFNKEADGQDLLSRSIYSDYQTVMGFYLRRIGMLKHFGIEARFPMLDHRLVEFVAGIPSNLKIKGFSDSKYIFKRAMEPVLPHDIIYRKDKLGHSVPLKNWIRDNETVRTFFMDWLSESVIRKRGFFNYDHVKTMLDDHLSKKRNNSHRLWAMIVLELWLRENLI
ncbi:asparagine synthase (glutamine-hydrolyzing) [candidate division KSB1 bacterium]|nr:asparagine synthase (glutamine-hydrolyzing) [candidate division KSB1 bacterium]